MGTEIIRAEHLSKAYKLYNKKSNRVREALSVSGKQYCTLFYALKDVSFSIGRGETVGIIGTNGSGKSTLLKILTGVTAPTAGTVAINGKVSALLELGAGFNPEYTGFENIALNGTMMGYSKEEMEQRREGIIRFADIGEYINQPVKNYSSGMFARLAFAVAISVEPEVLIVDETLSVGDVFFQSKCFRKFEELHEKGTSILFVSHDISAVKQMCSRVLWIENGKRQMFGACTEVCEAYFNAQTRRMNEQNEQYLKKLKLQQSDVSAAKVSESVFPSVSPSENSMLSDRAEILSTYVQDASGAYVGHMVAEHRYTVGVVTKFSQTMENVIVGFTLNNHKDIIVLATNTYEQTRHGVNVRAGQVLESRFTFVLPSVRTGQYEISPAVALGTQESHVNLTWLHGVLQIAVARTGYELAEIGVSMETEIRSINRYRLI